MPDLNDHEILSFDEITKRDPYFDFISHDYKIENLQEQICEFNLLPTVPESTQRIFKIAKDLYVFGFFNYDFFSASEFLKPSIATKPKNILRKVRNNIVEREKFENRTKKFLRRYVT